MSVCLCAYANLVTAVTAAVAKGCMLWWTMNGLVSKLVIATILPLGLDFIESKFDNNQEGDQLG